MLGIVLNKKTLVRWKIYVDRARMYINYINFAMIAFVFLNSIKDSGLRHLLDENKFFSYPLIIVGFFCLFTPIGQDGYKTGGKKGRNEKFIN